MNVEEAIAKLKEFNPKAELTTTFTETIAFSWVSDDTEDIEESKKNARVVFIEPAENEEEDLC